MKIRIEHEQITVDVECFVDPAVRVSAIAALAEALPDLIARSGHLDVPYSGPIYEVPTAANEVRRYSNGEEVQAGRRHPAEVPRPIPEDTDLSEEQQ
jgi:hypothetical protein